MTKGKYYEGVTTMETATSPARPNTRINLFRKYVRMITVEPFVFLCIASAVFKFVILPQYLLETLCNRRYNASICVNITQPQNTAKQMDIQASTAKWMLALYACSLTLSVFTIPLLGCLADVFGKKRTLCIPITLYTTQSIVYCILSSRPTPVAPGYLFIAIVIGGLSGDLVALIMLTSSYLSDITTDEQRTLRLTLLDGVANLSMCIFIFCSGHVISAAGYTRVFFVSIGMDVMAFVCLFVFVPDDANSCKGENRYCSTVAKSDETGEGRPNGNENHVENDETAVYKANDQADQIRPSADERHVEQNEAVVCEANVQTDQIKPSLRDSHINSDETAGYVTTLPAGGQSETGKEISNNTKQMQAVGEIKVKQNQSNHISKINPPKERKITLRLLLRESNPIRRFSQLAVLIKEQGDATQMVILLALLAFATMCIIGESLTLVLYIKNQPFNMDAVNVGYLLSLQGLLRFLGGYILLNLFFQRCSKWKDVSIICIAFVFNLIYYIVLGVANTNKMLYGIQIFGIFGPLASPTLRSVISKKGNPDNYALILSLAQTIDALSSFAVNLIVNSTYFAMVQLYPGAFCFILAAISAFGAIMSIFVKS